MRRGGRREVVFASGPVRGGERGAELALPDVFDVLGTPPDVLGTPPDVPGTPSDLPGTRAPLLSLIHISEPTSPARTSYAAFRFHTKTTHIP